MNCKIFNEWFTLFFVPQVKELLNNENLSLTVLILLDSAPSHSVTLQTTQPDVKVLFLPLNTTLLIQPINQIVIATFKVYYLRRVIKD